MPSQSGTIITILVADDHELTRKGVCSIINKVSDMKTVGEAGNGNEIKQLVATLQPKILLLDLKMPNLSPVELEKWVRENYPDTITLVLTAHDRASYLANMMEAGVAGYFDKKIRAGQLISAIRRAAYGQILFDNKQIEKARSWREDVSKKLKSLSGRECEVLIALTEGENNKKIAESLKITINTVEKHLTNIYKKLVVTSRSEAAIWWMEKGGGFRN